jgi:hypothetical protein
MNYQGVRAKAGWQTKHHHILKKVLGIIGLKNCSLGVEQQLPTHLQ